MIASHPMIEFRRLYRFFGATRAVNDISFTFETGKTNMIIGESGSGKTMLINDQKVSDLLTDWLA